MKIKIEVKSRGLYFSRRQVIIYYSEMNNGNVRDLCVTEYGKTYKNICRRMKLKYNGKKVGR